MRKRRRRMQMWKCVFLPIRFDSRPVPVDRKGWFILWTGREREREIDLEYGWAIRIVTLDRANVTANDCWLEDVHIHHEPVWLSRKICRNLISKVEIAEKLAKKERE